MKLKWDGKWPISTYGPTTRTFDFEGLFYYPIHATQSLRDLKVGDEMSVEDFDRETRIYVVREIHPFGLITEQIEGKPVFR